MTSLALPTLYRLLPILAGLSPLLIMSTSWGGSASYYLLFATSVLILLATRRLPPPWAAPLRSYDALAVGLSILVLAVIIGQAWHSSWHGSEIEKALRFALTPLILLAALRVPRNNLRYCLVGIMVGTWYAALNVAWLAYLTGTRPVTKEFNAVSYGDLTLLFATLSAFSLGWQFTRYRRVETALKLITALVGFAGFLLTQTRGGLLAVPFFVLIGLITWGHISLRSRLVFIAGAIMAFALAAQADGPLRQRIGIGIDQYQHCATSPLDDTSVCIRLQLWKAAWGMIKSEPLLGVGGGNTFRNTLQTLHEQGKVSAFVAQNFGETHNDLLYFFATYGLLGGLGILAVYIVPGCYFASRLRRGDATQRAAAAAGLAICVGFAVFGLTEMMFRGMRTAALYATWIAIYLALSHPAGQQDGASRV